MPPAGRMIFVSPWICVIALVLGVFTWCGVGLAAGYGGSDIGSRLIGIGILLVVDGLGIAALTSRIVIADARGFHPLLRRRVSWDSVQWAEPADFAPGLLPNVAVRVIGKETDPSTGSLREYVVGGLAGFAGSDRPRRIAAHFNDWIAAADPDWVVNPWVHRSRRPDHR